MVSKYSVLNNISWLKQQYLTEQMSPADIANIVGCGGNTVRRSLIENGLQIRSRKEARRSFFGDDGFSLNDLDVFNGSMLGDAHIRWDYPVFSKSNIGYDHVTYVANRLFPNNPDPASRISTRKTRLKGKEYKAYSIQSFYHDFLATERERWYRHNGDKWIKIVPRDLRLTPGVILHWFLDDGYSCYAKSTAERPIIEFASMSFVRDDNEFLCESLNALYRLESYVRKSSCGTGCFVAIPSKKAAEFYEVIGSCPQEIPSMKYKWKHAPQYIDPLIEVRNRDWLATRYIDRDMSIQDIAHEANASVDWVKKWLSKYRIIKKKGSGEMYPQLTDKGFLERLYLEQGLTTREIAEIINSDKATVSRWMRIHGIALRPSGRAGTFKISV